MNEDDSASRVAIAGHYSGLVLPAGREDRPFVYVNMVASADGKSTVDGSERGLGSASDKRMMQELRVHADAIMNGASTLRISGSTPRVLPSDLKTQRIERGLARQPIGVVVSRGGDMPLDVPFFTSREFDAVVIVTEATARERVEAIRATGRSVETVPDGPDNGIDIARVLKQKYGVRRLLCEGGPTLNAILLHAEVVDEFFLTLAPWLVGGAANLSPVEGAGYHRGTMPRLQLLQQLHDASTDELYLRYAVSYGASGARAS
ncbi:MAG: RibD family protein [Dehalococcoidia bacterium]